MSAAVADGSASTLRVAVCQLNSVDSVEANLKQIMGLLERLEAEPPDLVCFPENSLYMRVKEGESIGGVDLKGPTLQTISSWAKAHGSVVHLGSVPVKREGRLYSSSLVITPEGGVHDSYQKIHLFDVDVEGHKPVRESDVFTHGEEPSIFFVKGWKIGGTICYDLRFSELFLRYAQQEVDAILVPAAFLVPTGQAHWEVLTRARAIESQAYVLAAAQGGVHKGINGGSRSTYGHSMIIDPWGVVIQSCNEETSEARILKAELSRDRIKRVRAQIPMKNHRRLT